MEVTVLGPPSIRFDGENREVGSRIQRLLAALVIANGDVVSVDRLVDIVWESLPPRRAESTLKSYVTRLRKAMQPSRTELIQFRGSGYQLELDSNEIDSALFEAELDEAHRLLRLADAEGAVKLLERGLSRWYGQAYGVFADEEWARPEVVRLEGRRIEAQQVQIEAFLAVGAHDRAIAECQGLIEREPLAEKPRELLMRSLHAAGRQAEALRVLPEFRAMLQNELGLMPSPALVEVESRIAQRDPSMERVSGQQLRGFEVGNRIGEGAFAVVHQAKQLAVGRHVAIKIIRAELADRPDFIRRFEHEARIVASVEHPNVVPLYDFWREPGAAYLVMRLLRGGSVADALRKGGPFSKETALKLLVDIGSALAAAHRAGVVHRDVRPANLLLDEEGSGYLTDFGIAVSVASTDQTEVLSPTYAAPEVLRGESVGPAADVLSLSVTVFEMLTGQVPFADTDDRAELISRQLNDPLPSVRSYRTDVPERLDEVLARGASKLPGDRHATVAAFVADVQGALSSTRAPARIALPIVDGQPNPYVGLHAFDESSADRFFGREQLVGDAIDALTQEPFVALVGPSGSGKSSLARAGVIPKLRRGAVPGAENWFITTMFPGPSAFEALEAALLRIAVNPPTSLRDQLLEERGLARAIKRVLPTPESVLLVVLDQFEELFTQADNAGESTRFLKELAAAIDQSDGRLRVLTTVRADHYDHPLQIREISDLLNHGTVTVGPMTPDELERAIVKPARLVGADLEPALVAELVAEVSSRPSALPLMQFALTELYDRRVSGLMLAETYASQGRLTGVIAARADGILAAGDSEDEEAARRIFGRLAVHGQARRRALRTEFGNDPRIVRLLDEFTAARLVSVDRDSLTREPTVEVAHEALLRDWPWLTTWLEQHREDLRVARVVSEGSGSWQSSDRDEGELARGARLQAVIDLRDRRPEMLNETELEWVQRSQAGAEAEELERAVSAARDRRQNRRLRASLAAAAVLLAMASIGGGLAFVQRGRALDAQEVAEIERLVAQSAAQHAEQPDRAILLALEANRRSDTLETQTAVHRALAAEPRLLGIFPSLVEDATHTDVSADGTFGATASATKISWFDGRSGTEIGGSYELSSSPTKLGMSGNGEILAVGQPGGEVMFLDTGGAIVGNSINVGSDFGSIELDHEGELLLSTVDDLRLFDVKTGAEIMPAYAPGDGFTITYSALAESHELAAVAMLPPFDSEDLRAPVDLVDTRSGTRVQRIDDGARQATVLEASNGDHVAVGYVDGSVSLISLSDLGTAMRIQAHADFVTAIAFQPDGGLVTAGSDGEIKFWSSDGEPAGPPVSVSEEVVEIAVGQAGAVTAVFVDGSRISLATGGGVLVEDFVPVETFSSVSPYVRFYNRPADTFRSVELVDLPSNQVIRKIDFASLHPDGTRAPRFTPDGKWVMTVGTQSFDFGISEVEGDRQFLVPVKSLFVDEYELRADEVGPFTVRPESGGRRVFAAVGVKGDGFRAVWIDTSDGAIVSGPLDFDAGVQPRSLLLTDGRVLVGGPESSLNILSPELDRDPTVLPDTVGQWGFYQDRASGLVVIGGTDQVLGVLDPDTLAVDYYEGVVGSPVAAAFSPDGDQIAVVTSANSVQVFDVAQKRAIGVPMTAGPGGVTDISAVRWEQDGQSVWVTTFLGPARVPTTPNRWKEIACSVVNRELSTEEWTVFVADDEPPVPACE